MWDVKQVPGEFWGPGEWGSCIVYGAGLLSFQNNKMRPLGGLRADMEGKEAEKSCEGWDETRTEWVRL